MPAGQRPRPTVRNSRTTSVGKRPPGDNFICSRHQLPVKGSLKKQVVEIRTVPPILVPAGQRPQPTVRNSRTTGIRKQSSGGNFAYSKHQFPVNRSLEKQVVEIRTVPPILLPGKQPTVRISLVAAITYWLPESKYTYINILIYAEKLF